MRLTWKLFFLDLVVVLLTLYVLKTWEPRIVALPEKSIEIPDLIFPPRTPEYVYQQIAFMGVTGREIYSWYNILDMLVFQNASALLLLTFFSLGMQKPRWKWLENGYQMVFAMWLMDMTENLAVLFLLRVYPLKAMPALRLICIVTPLKFVFAALSVLFGLLAWLGTLLNSRDDLKRVTNVKKKLK